MAIVNILFSRYWASRCHLRTRMCLLGIFFFLFECGYGQSLRINNGAQLTLRSNAALHFKGFTMIPSKTQSLRGEQSWVRGNESTKENTITRHYQFSQMISNFTGTLVFNYAGADLKDVSASDLVLLLKDAEATWQAFQPSIDEEKQTLTYRFNTPVNFTSVTAGRLAIVTGWQPEPDEMEVLAFPNPVLQVLYFQTVDSIEEIQVYDTNGKVITVQVKTEEIDFSQIPSGVYWVKVVLSTEKTRTLKIIKQ